MLAINKEVVVAASQETAFNVFTQQIDLWWPKTHHIGKCNLKEAILEPGLNGRWYALHEDGSITNNGYVMVWDPYSRLVLAWQINGNFQYDPSLISELEINFIPEGPTTTRVKLEHRDLEKLTGGPKVIADMDQGWTHIINLYKGSASGKPTPQPAQP